MVFNSGFKGLRQNTADIILRINKNKDLHNSFRMLQ